MEVTSYLLGKKQGGGGSEPTGTINITSNGTHNVKSYASAIVDVEPDLEAKSVTITENTTTTITPTQGKDGISSVSVTTNVPTGITPTGTINITENGTHDVTNYASASVNVSGGGQEFTIKRGTSNDSRGGFGYVLDQIPSITIDDTSSAYMFSSFYGKKIPELKGTSNVTNMSYMFNKSGVYNDKIDTSALKKFDTSNVTNMQSMFYMFKGINLDLSSFDTSNVTNMQSMFSDTSYVATLDISSFDLSSVTNYSNMFLRCGAYANTNDGAYASGIPYIYVKDATMQNWVLTESNGHPSTWTTDNVIIKTT